jgi:hypothetical protein
MSRCDKCKYWELITNDYVPQKLHINHISYGFCRRFPSGTVSLDEDLKRFWEHNHSTRYLRIASHTPIKAYDDWCGEFSECIL